MCILMQYEMELMYNVYIWNNSIKIHGTGSHFPITF